MTTLLDPVTQQVIQGGLRGISQEMVTVVMRTAHSPILREGGDCSAALFDRHGSTVAQAKTLALHLGAIPTALEGILEIYGDDVHPGDVFMMNDPDEGGMHLPDVFIFRPAFVAGVLVGWSGTVAHQMDVGGRVAGSIAVDSTDIFQEGIQLPVLKWFERGVENRAVTDILRKNIRFPHETLGDLRSQASACRTGELGLVRLATEHGPDRLQQYFDAILDNTEILMRSGIAAIPDGTYAFEDYIDDDGLGSGEICIAVTLTVHGDELTADFAGSSPQTKAALNGTLSTANAAVYAAVQSVVGVPDELDNAGAWRPIKITAPQGTIVNPTRPASRGARGLTLVREFDTVMGALHKALPDVAPAPGADIDLLVFLGNNEGQPEQMFLEAICGGWGAGPFGDGVEGVSGLLVNTSNQPVEFVETIFPLRIEEYGFVTDTAGPGAFIVASAIRRTYRFLLDEGFVQIRSDRRVRGGPYGVRGGRAGLTSSSSVRFANGDKVELPGISRQVLHRDDLVFHVTSGGGGFGDPLTRDPQLVLEDVQSGKLSVARASEVFGVEVDLELGVAVRVTDEVRV
ncbi:MAG: N-methylhydantoinase [Acidimicrobiia bacterium]|nr:N-methylhydantoinase [Acidimicrobiia bacterium]